MCHIEYILHNILYTNSVWISCLFLFSIFASVSICETDSCFVLVWLGHQDYNGLIKYTGDLALVFYFLERLFVRSYYFSLEFLEKNCPQNILLLVLFVACSILYTYVYIAVVYCGILSSAMLIFLLTSYRFIQCQFLLQLISIMSAFKNYTAYLSFQIYWSGVVHVILL